MIFDDLCGVIERHRPELTRHAKAARLFRIEPCESGVARDAETWTINGEPIQNLRLPFDTIAIESAPERESRGSHCTILFGQAEGSRVCRFMHLRTSTDGVVGQVLALGSLEMFPAGEITRSDDPEQAHRLIEIEAWSVDRSKLRPVVDASADLIPISPKLAPFVDTARTVRDGIERDERTEALLREAGMSRDELASEALAAVAAQEAAIDAIVHRSVRTELALTCLHVAYITQPSRFIVEERPLAPPGKVKPGSILRSPWRPHFIVLEPAEIRRRLSMPNPVSPTGTRAPHEKRGHWRRYTSERYREARGTVRWIDACWVGPREAILGPNRYVVRVDA